MNIIIDESPLLNSNKNRGVGVYTKNLLLYLPKIAPIFTIRKGIIGDLVYKKNTIYHYTYFDIYKRTLKVNKNAKTALTVHDLTPLKFPRHFPAGTRGKINWLFQKKALQGVNAVITDSENSKKDIENIANINKNKIFVVYLAADDAFRKLLPSEITKLNVRKKYALPEQYILYVGDVNWNKNVTGLIQVFHKIKVMGNADFNNVKLVLVGEVFKQEKLPEVSEINNLISNLKLINNVIKVDFVPLEDLVAIYNGASCYVQPSWYEGFGLPVLEAMKCGVPVACSNRGSLPEVGGDAVLYFNPENENEMVNAIAAVCLDKVKRSELINEGKKQAKKFSWEKTARETMRVYKKFVDEN